MSDKWSGGATKPHAGTSRKVAARKLVEKKIKSDSCTLEQFNRMMDKFDGIELRNRVRKSIEEITYDNIAEEMERKGKEVDSDTLNAALDFVKGRLLNCSDIVSDILRKKDFKRTSWSQRGEIEA